MSASGKQRSLSSREYLPDPPLPPMPAMAGVAISEQGPVVQPNVFLQQPIKVQPPDRFDGKDGDVRTFLVQLRLCFGFQPQQFETEYSKVLYAASYLKGPATK